MNTDKRVLSKVFTVCFFVATSFSQCPQVSFDSLLVRFCTSEGKCIDRVSLQKCVSPESVLDGTSYLEIYTNLSVLRRGFIHDLLELNQIFAARNDISRINPGAFLNLPKLSDVILSDCKITEILWGVFSNTFISHLVLDKNFISLIENEAFSNMPNLRSLNLEDNRLTTYNKNWLTNSHNLEIIRLAHNQIDTIPERAFDGCPNLQNVDLSFNIIKQLEPGIFNNVRRLAILDLTGNKLWSIPATIFGTDTDVNELQVSLNRLSHLGKDLLNAGKVKSLVLHPNPWQCSCLDQIREWMRDNNATLATVKLDNRIHYQNGAPECIFSRKGTDRCVEGYSDESSSNEETYFNAVNYTNWVYVGSSRAKPECDCCV